jgi:hypothetical protein
MLRPRQRRTNEDAMRVVIAALTIAAALSACGGPAPATSPSPNATVAATPTPQATLSDAAYVWCQTNYEAVVAAGLKLGTLHNPMVGDERKIVDAIFADKAGAETNPAFIRTCNAAFDAR